MQPDDRRHEEFPQAWVVRRQEEKSDQVKFVLADQILLLYHGSFFTKSSFVANLQGLFGLFLTGMRDHQFFISLTGFLEAAIKALKTTFISYASRASLLAAVCGSSSLQQTQI